MTRWIGRWSGVAAAFEPRNMPLAVGRSLLAVAELAVVVFNSDSNLFPRIPELPAGPRCDGLRGLSLWCVGEQWPILSRILAAVILLAVASGYRPRWTCVPHWYIMFSLSASMPSPNGGEQVARVLALLLVPICLGDGRRWHWQRPVRPLPPAWRGAAYAASLVMRVQVVVIYVDAALSKLLEPAWRDGTAMRYVINDPFVGPPDMVRALVESGEAEGRLLLLLGWGTIVVELFLACAVLGRARLRASGLLVGGVLHGTIFVFLGLGSFELVMISLLIIVTLPGGSLLSQAGTGPRTDQGRSDTD
ncbi:sporulation-delaying protein SdpB family protein [Nonomuraea sp. NPDC050663]|uniref:sporulation-delaying protein SdpB family protein n=1 Tax=Nonomuraea sp. NPDC050663 TaxID=3364370 RepID=UPI003790D518